MKIKLLLGIILVLSVILQSTFFDHIKIFNVKPDLMLIAIVIISLSLDFKWIMVFSYFSGFLKDVLAALPLGVNTLVLPLIAFFIFRLSKRIVLETNYAISITIFMASLFENLIVSLLLIALEFDISIGVFFRLTIISSIYTSVVFLLTSKALNFLKIKQLLPHIII